MKSLSLPSSSFLFYGTIDPSLKSLRHKSESNDYSNFKNNSTSQILGPTTPTASSLPPAQSSMHAPVPTVKSESKCMPAVITPSHPGPLRGLNLPGGWTEMEDYKGDKMKFDKWISRALDIFNVSHDINSSTTISHVYSQVVAGVNYWISFDITPYGSSYWLLVNEPLLSSLSSEKLSILESQNNFIEGGIIQTLFKC